MTSKGSIPHPHGLSMFSSSPSPWQEEIPNNKPQDHSYKKNPTERHRCQHEQISQPCIQTKNGGFHDPKSNIDNILMKYRKKKYSKKGKRVTKP